LLLVKLIFCIIPKAWRLEETATCGTGFDAQEAVAAVESGPEAGAIAGLEIGADRGAIGRGPGGETGARGVHQTAYRAV
jgi:hypothetical protein